MILKWYIIISIAPASKGPVACYKVLYNIILYHVFGTRFQSCLKPFTIMDVIHLQLFLIMKTKNNL